MEDSYASGINRNRVAYPACHHPGDMDALELKQGIERSLTCQRNRYSESLKRRNASASGDAVGAMMLSSSRTV